MHDDHEPRRLAGRTREAPAVEFRAERRRTRARRSGWIGRLAAGLALLLLGGIGAVGILLYLQRGPAAQEAGPGAAAAPASPPAISATNLVARQAQQWGVSDCLAQTAALSDFLTRNMDYSWLARRGDGDANRELFSATIAGRQQGSGIQGISGLFAAPVGEGRCNAGYQTTMYFPDTCPRTREVVFPTFSSRIEFGTVAEAYATADGRATLYLLPAGPGGCVAVKAELFY